MVYRHLTLPSHPFAEAAARASECASDQGRFEKMHDILFASQQHLGKVDWRNFARDAGVEDMQLFDKCMKDDSISRRIQRDGDTARKLGMRGTPSILVNGGVQLSGVPSGPMLDSLLSLGREQPNTTARR